MSKWNEWKKSLGDSRPWHLLDPSRIIEDESIIKKRLDICLSCEHLINLTKQCKMCGCIMTQKTKLAAAECPIQKWTKEEF